MGWGLCHRNKDLDRVALQLDTVCARYQVQPVDEEELEGIFLQQKSALVCGPFLPGRCFLIDVLVGTFTAQSKCLMNYALGACGHSVCTVASIIQEEFKLLHEHDTKRINQLEKDRQYWIEECRNRVHLD